MHLRTLHSVKVKPLSSYDVGSGEELDPNYAVGGQFTSYGQWKLVTTKERNAGERSDAKAVWLTKDTIANESLIWPPGDAGSDERTSLTVLEVEPITAFSGGEITRCVCG